jgi:hypothetical protein
MEKKQIILPSKKYFKAEEEDLTLRIGLDETDTLLRQGDKDIILDIAQLFDKERNESIKYKIYGKLKMVFRNLYEGITEYAPLKRNLFYSNYGVHEDIENPDYTGYVPYNEFAFLRRDVLREVIQMNSGDTLNSEITYTPSLTGTTYTGHTITSVMDAPYKNWNLYLSYVYDHDNDYPIKYTLTGSTEPTIYNFTAKDGIPFRVSDNGNYYTLTSPVEHGMVAGEYITLSTTGSTFYKLSGSTTVVTTDVIDRTFNIESVGNEVHRSEKFVINILKTDLVVGTTFNSVVFGKRCLDINDITGTTSQYYVHKHKTLTSTSDYILDKVGFESPIWEEEKGIMSETSEGDIDYIVEQNRMESVLFDFKEPFLLSGITNNLGYTPTDVYVSVIFRNGNGYFNYPPKVGYKFNFHDLWVDMQFSGTTSIEDTIPTTTFTSNESESFTGGTDVQIGTVLTGAFVEYNESELKERIISESYHKFSIREDIFDHNQSSSLIYSNREPVGLFYQPHYRIKLRQLSPYIESSNTDEILNLPENTKYFEEDGIWRWRDLYDHGYIDPDGYGTEYPFINGIHYIKNDINFYLRNEELYKNKLDGITKFKDKNTTDC